MKKIILIIIILILLPVWYYFNSVNTPINNGTTKVFSISKGESIDDISDNLKSAGLINCPLCLKIYLKLSGSRAKIMAGEYQIVPGKNLKDIISQFVNGKVIDNESNIKIIEGWTISDIDKYLSENKTTIPNEFKTAATRKIGDWQFSFSKPEFLSKAPANADLEGYLFPDTYRIFKNASVEDVINKMLDNFDSKLTPEMRQAIDKSGRSSYETIIMASIIEKEVRSYDDMRIVSGIFWDRIKNGQGLESDATLTYILGQKKDRYTIDETHTDSPYNTYRYKGLPPGPVSNPGINAIKAAIYPEYTDYNYFLSRSDNGETIFSKTYEEHLKNKAKYLK